MERRRIKHEASLEERLAEQARRLREQAKTLPPGKERDGLMRRAREAEITSHINEWSLKRHRKGQSATRFFARKSMNVRTR
jgi:hypothetical protein